MTMTSRHTTWNVPTMRHNDHADEDDDRDAIQHMASRYGLTCISFDHMQPTTITSLMMYLRSFAHSSSFTPRICCDFLGAKLLSLSVMRPLYVVATC
uniref:Uncharacterized protein n=1 Tax=Rhipicephalus zambeziensis TaxID=60191 RepID=A0A224Y8W2_9ACAR